MGRSSTGRWIAVGSWIAVIYATIPFVLQLRAEFVSHWPAEFIAFAVMGVVVAAAVAALWMVRQLGNGMTSLDIAWIVGVAVVLLGWTWRLMEQPEETVHFLEYGVLAVLLYRALRPHADDPGVFVAGAVIGTIVGTVDEIIQWVTPGRYWDYRDLVINGGASVLAQIVIWRLAKRTRSRITPRTARILVRLVAVEMLILTICLSATPRRLEALARTFPVVTPLAAGNDVMAEYGFMHRLDARTLFRSRLTRAELAAEDRLRADEAAALLDQSGGRYGAFMRSVPATDDPFAYEARVHIFARDGSFAEARRDSLNSRQRRRSMTEAAREDQILTHVFGATLDRSRFLWSDRRRAAADAAQDPEAHFESSVASHLITWVSEPVLRAMMLAAVALLVVADRALGRRISPTRCPPRPA